MGARLSPRTLTISLALRSTENGPDSTHSRAARLPVCPGGPAIVEAGGDPCRDQNLDPADAPGRGSPAAGVPAGAAPG